MPLLPSGAPIQIPQASDQEPQTNSNYCDLCDQEFFLGQIIYETKNGDLVCAKCLEESEQDDKTNY